MHIHVQKKLKYTWKINALKNKYYNKIFLSWYIYFIYPIIDLIDVNTYNLQVYLLIYFDKSGAYKNLIFFSSIIIGNRIDLNNV